MGVSLYLIAVVLWFLSVEDCCGVAVYIFFLFLLSFITFMVHAPLLAGLINYRPPKSKAWLLIAWIARGAEFAIMTGASLSNRWAIADQKPVAALTCFSALLAVWVVLSLVAVRDPFLGYVEAKECKIRQPRRGEIYDLGQELPHATQDLGPCEDDQLDLLLPIFHNILSHPNAPTRTTSTTRTSRMCCRACRPR